MDLVEPWVGGRGFLSPEYVQWTSSRNDSWANAEAVFVTLKPFRSRTTLLRNHH